MDFPGYYNFSLTYARLKQMIENPESNREWKRMLSSISGIYIILDIRSGKQYIGSAYGRGGIWGRWRKYSKNPTGGNKHIKAVLDKYPNRYNSFQFSILRVMEPGTTKNQIIEQESKIKEKLGSRAYGLNLN